MYYLIYIYIVLTHTPAHNRSYAAMDESAGRREQEAVDDDKDDKNPWSAPNLLAHTI